MVVFPRRRQNRWLSRRHRHLEPSGNPPRAPAGSGSLPGNIDTSFNVQMYDIDLFDTPKSTIDTLHGQGRVVICYFSAGSWEDWRPDAADFPANVKGNSNGWPGEKWLDIRNIAALSPIMQARLDLAVDKGCDGVEPDNVDGYNNKTGFPLTGNDQLTYNRWLADQAHARGLSVGLKNDVEQVTNWSPISTGLSTNSASSTMSAICCCRLYRPARRYSAWNTAAVWIRSVPRQTAWILTG